MDYKMLCLDIDGTLLNSKHEISNETKQAIYTLPPEFPVVLVSARMPKGILYLHQELKLETPIICYSGALVIHVNKDGSYEAILNQTMGLEAIQATCVQAKMHGVHIGFYQENEWYIEEQDQWAVQEQNIAKTNPVIIDYQALFNEWNAIHSGAHKVLCMGAAEEIESMEQVIKKRYGGELSIYRSKPTYLEIMHHTVSKTTAIRLLQGRFNLDRSQIIAVGDNFNDMDMLEYAGLGIAMGNAPEQVKQIANEVTASNDDHGVAKVIHKYLRGLS